MKTILSLTVLLLAASPTLAEKTETGKAKRDPEVMFKKLDANSDAAVSKEEWNASRRAKNDPERAAKAFTAKDKDADGKLTKEEYLAAGSRRAKK